MKIDFSEGRVYIVICPVDGRYGYFRLSQIAMQYLSIDLAVSHDWVVFVSTRRKIARIIHRDEKGGLMINRYLNEGKYQWLTGLADGPALKEIDLEILSKYLDGETVEIRRKELLKE